jgi:hypothetical protein
LGAKLWKDRANIDDQVHDEAQKARSVVIFCFERKYGAFLDVFFQCVLAN